MTELPITKAIKDISTHEDYTTKRKHVIDDDNSNFWYAAQYFELEIYGVKSSSAKRMKLQTNGHLIFQILM